VGRVEEVAAIRIFRADIDAGRLMRPDYDLAEVFIQAERLSARHSGDIGSRSLDVLHVAAALQCGCTSLASFDERQRKIAALAGLKLLPTKSKKSLYVSPSSRGRRGESPRMGHKARRRRLPSAVVG